MATRPTVLDNFFGPAILRKDGVDYPQRPVLDVQGAEITDDPVTGATKLNFAGTAMHVDDDGIAHLDVNEVRSDLGTDCHVRSRLYRFTTTSDTPLTVDLVTYDSLPPKTFVRLDLVLIVRGAASDPQCGSFSIRALVKKDVSAASVAHGGTDPAPYGGGGFPFDAQIVTDNGQQKIRLILTGDYITGGSVFFAELRMQMVDWT